MKQGVSTIQRISQHRLNGTLKIIGSTRSQSVTEKQMATKGIAASASAERDGAFTYDGLPESPARRPRAARGGDESDHAERGVVVVIALVEAHAPRLIHHESGSGRGVQARGRMLHGVV